MILVGCSPAGVSRVSGGGEFLPHSFDVRYEGGVIRALGSLDPAPEESVLDLDGAFLCPGLVDSHVHLALGGNECDQSDDPAARAADNAAAHLDHGVTAVRDLGGGPADENPAGRAHDESRADRRAREKNGVSPGAPRGPRSPRVVPSFGAITRRGRYGGFLGLALDLGDDVEQAVKGRIAAGAKVVKVILTGSVDFERAQAAPAHFTRAEMRRMVAVAHEQGIPVAVHANGPEAIRMAAEEGADSIEHGILADAAAIAAMAETEVVWVPTLSPLHALASSGRWPGLPGILADHCAMVVNARDAGVRVAAGTDAGSPGVPHGALLAEIAHLRAIGLGPDEAREAAGPVGADLLGLGGGYARLEVGAATDLVWFDGDPFSGRWSPTDLPRVLGVLAGS